MPLNGFGIYAAILADERRVEHGVGQDGAAAEGRLGAELLENQLLDGVVEHAETRADAGFSSRATGSRPMTTARGKRFVVSLGHAGGNSSVARKHQTEREHGLSGASLAAIGGAEHTYQGIVGGELAGIDFRHLAGPEGLHVMADVGQRRI